MLPGLMLYNKMKIYNPIGLTLIELLVASSVIGLIMLGVITSNITLQKNTLDYANSYYVLQNTNQSLNHILAAASLAVGTPNNPGVALYNPRPSRCRSTARNGEAYMGQDQTRHNLCAVNSGDPNTFCFHQNVDPTDVTWPGMVDPTKDRWLCYTFSSPNISWCTKTFSSGPSSCSGSGNVETGTLGTAKTVTASFSLNSYCFSIPCDGRQKALFNVTIINCKDPTANCSPGNANNPYVVKSGSVSPPGHSAG